MNWEMSSIRGFVNILQESLPEECKALEDKMLIPFSQPDERVLLQGLDQARKAYDLSLGAIGHEADGLDPRKVHNMRIILNSLRKWRGPVKAYCETPDKSELKLTDVTSVLKSARERAAIEGFILRNTAAGARDENPNLLLLCEMNKVIRFMLRDYISEYEAAKPRFGKGAVAESMSVLCRWDKLVRENQLTSDYMDIEWTSPPGRSVARLCAVPKQWDKDRLITVEPYASTYLQHKARLALGRTLCKNGFGFLVDQGISGYDGPKAHRNRAREASVYNSPESHWATFDLTDASDSITYNHVVEVFPPEVVATLDRCRSEFFCVSGSSEVQNTTHRMAIYGGMGNATTFMVQTVLFYALMRATSSMARLTWKGGSVVGDDILIKGLDNADVLVKGLTALGFNINHSKSFSGLSTPVRESCGCWAFNGFDVYVPPFIGFTNAKGEHLLALAEFIRCAPAPLKQPLLDRCVTWVNTPVPVANTVSVCDPNRTVTHSRIRWNPTLFRLEVKALVPQTKLEYVDYRYEASHGGCLAVLASQVITAPLPARFTSQEGKKRLLAIRQQLRVTYIDSLPIDARPSPESVEDKVDELMRYWRPDLWKYHAIAAAKPYSFSLEHRWVPLTGSDGVVPGSRFDWRKWLRYG